MSNGKKPKLRILTSTANSRTLRKEVRVEVTRFASKQIDKLPKHIRNHVLQWVEALHEDGIEKTRMCAGYHDEPLRGTRAGQRSIRLNRSWRLIYEEHEFETKTWITITVIEVNKHAY